jgi:hypothetical protein
MQHRFQRMPLSRDGLGRWSERGITFGGDAQGFVSFVSELNTFDLNSADVAVMG